MPLRFATVAALTSWRLKRCVERGQGLRCGMWEREAWDVVVEARKRLSRFASLESLKFRA